MNVKVNTKMNEFYSRFSIKKQLSERDTFSLLCTRIKDSTRAFIYEYVTPQDFWTPAILGLDELINKQFSEHYGHSIFDNIDPVNYIDNASDILDVLEFVQLFLAIIEESVKKKLLGKDALRSIASRFIDNLEKCNIDVSLVKIRDRFILLPKGAKELDEELVINNLIWLAEYKKAYKEYEKALSLYSRNQDIRLIVDSLRLCLETFLKEFFNKDKHLDNLKTDYREFLEEKGIAPEIRKIFESSLAFYINYNNDKVKHNNRVYEQEVEFLIYQTGVFLRMFITLKNAEKKK